MWFIAHQAQEQPHTNPKTHKPSIIPPKTQHTLFITGNSYKGRIDTCTINYQMQAGGSSGRPLRYSSTDFIKLSSRLHVE